MTRWPLLLACSLALLALRVALGQEEGVPQDLAVSEAIERLSADDVRTRWSAAYALGQMDADAAAAVEPLAKVLREDAHEYVRDVAAWALGRIGGDNAATSVDALQTTLRSSLPSVRRNAAAALGELGPAAEGAVGELVARLDDPDAIVRVRAAEALWRIARHDRAVPALTAISRQQEGPGAYHAVAALGRLRVDDPAALPALAAALGHPLADAARAAARALGEMGPSALPAVRKAMQADNQQTQREAVEALRWMGPAALDDLTAAMKSASGAVRRGAARALGELAAEAATVEPVLVEAVGDADADVREAAHRALRQIRKAKAAGL